MEEYYRMAEVGILTENDKVELIHGEIIEMSPVGSKHAAVVDRINNVLKSLIKDRAIIRVQSPVLLNDLNQPEPDVTILKPSDNYYSESHPGPDDIFILVEVADSSLPYDRQIKLPLYASAGVPEFWLVNLEKQEIEIHRSPSKNVYKKIEIFQPDDDISCFDHKVNVRSLLGA
ncbi:hypothetical protein C900_03669 [Fulvivirga imtechensis AK7]|uniref:Putative restriction endonuclease domain-containing protein n=1 Tax=Fulvivirga imtechensis AK7 TaxID=1237149 RepID=L8JNU2_9BACT|nr:hypothetical protein C900_03669 [Fulvivirga imtechensis AK7]